MRAATAVPTCGARPLFCASSTSRLTMRPCGPEPASAASSMPAALASRRASGDAKIRPCPFAASPRDARARGELFPSPSRGGDRGGGLAGDARLGGHPALTPTSRGDPAARAAGAGAGAFPALGGRGGCAPAFGLGAAPAVSPSPSSVAIGVLTFTPSVPSATSRAPTLPSSVASTSMVALSVSISAMTSPALMVWPSLTSHLASLPSSMVGDSAGIRMSVGIGRSVIGT